MIGVTLLAGLSAYVAREGKIVSERNGWRANPHFFEPVTFTDASDSLSFLRRLMGDAECFVLVADDSVSNADLEQCQAAFPESRVLRDSDYTGELGRGHGSRSMTMRIHTFRDGTCKIDVVEPATASAQSTASPAAAPLNHPAE